MDSSGKEDYVWMIQYHAARRTHDERPLPPELSAVRDRRSSTPGKQRVDNCHTVGAMFTTGQACAGGPHPTAGIIHRLTSLQCLFRRRAAEHTEEVTVGDTLSPLRQLLPIGVDVLQLREGELALPALPGDLVLEALDLLDDLGVLLSLCSVEPRRRLD